MRTKAKESRLVSTARRKLEKQLQKEKEHFNSDSLARAALIIRASIQRHQIENLSNRSVTILKTPQSKGTQICKGILKNV